MQEIRIEDLETTTVSGVSVVEVGEAGVPKENYFAWRASPLTATFQRAEIGGGFLKSWRHAPVFDEVETHEDQEAFFFVSGTALMVFGDVKGGKVLPESLQIVRIKPCTELIVDAGKAHYVAVAEGDEPIRAVVISPKMAAPKLKLAEPVRGI